MRFTFGFPTIAGVLFNLPILLNSVKSVLDWKGRYDAASSLKESGGALMEFLDLPSWFYLVALIVGLGLIWWDTRRPWKEITVSISPLAAALVISALALGAWGWFFYDRSRGPIVWVTSTGSPIGFQKAVGAPLLVSGFYLIGNNKTDRPVTFKDAYLRSDNTDQTVRFKIGVPGEDITPEEATLQPLGNINMYGRYPAPDAEQVGISIDRFRSEFGRFTFHVEYSDGRIYERHYSASEVDDLIKQADEHHSKLLSKAPGIIRKPN